MNSDTLRARLRGVVQPSKPTGEPMMPGPEPAAVPPLSYSTEDVLGGEWRQTSHGRSFVVTRRVAGDARYGAHTVGEFFAELHQASASASLFGAATAQPPFVFFDLETTGLSGGAGTCAFLVGCGRFEADGSFLTEQHLMVDAAAEPAMLRLVAEELAKAGALVTFNGKSFDAPVIETRYLFHRCESPCARLPHLDVLHPARRFWGPTLTDGCSLIALESKLLGATRMGDVPGFEIPARYFHFVRSGDARPLAAVFEHNRLDLLSLAGLCGRLLSMAEHGPETARDAHEAMGLGRLYERGGVPWRAEQAFERAAVLSGSRLAYRQVRIEALRALAIEARRARRYQVAAERWQQVVDAPACPPNLAREAAEALAIHHEHRVRDLETAKKFALKSLESNQGVAWGDAIRHRLARIERKMVSERRPLFSWLSPQPSAAPPSAPRTSS